MLRKTIPTLAGSILLASEASAISFNPGDNVLLVFSTTGHGSYWLDTGVSADTISYESSSLYSQDLSSISTALGGSIEQFGMLGLTSATGPTIYNYEELFYVDVGSGIVYASESPTENNSATTLYYDTRSIRRFLENAQFGHNTEGSAGDLDNRDIPFPGIFGVYNELLVDIENADSASFRHRINVQTGAFDSGVETADLPVWSFTGWDICPNGPLPDPGDGDCPSFYQGPAATPFQLWDDTLYLGYIARVPVSTPVPLPGSALLFISASVGILGFKQSLHKSKNN